MPLSKIEACFAVMLNRRKIPWLSDGLVYCEYHQWWAHQMDLFTLPDMKAPGQPGLPIDWELDDAHHEEIEYVKKDASRDEALMDCDQWWIRRPVIEGYTQMPPRNARDGWVIFRLPYGILKRCVDIKTTKLKGYNIDIIDIVDGMITEAWSARKPKKVIWID